MLAKRPHSVHNRVMGAAMTRMLEIVIEPGDQKVIVRLDEKRPDKAELEIRREDGEPLRTVETLRQVAA